MAEESTQTGAEIQDGTTDTQSPGDEKTYTQQEMDSIIQKRLDRERASAAKRHDGKLSSAAADAVQQWRDEQGLDDDALEKFAGMDKAGAEARTMKGQLTKATKAADRLRGERDAARDVATRMLTRDAVISEAAKVANDPEDIWLRMQSRIRVADDYSGVELLDLNGDLSDETMADAVKGILEKSPHLAKPTGAAGSGGRPSVTGPSNGNPKQGQKMSRADRLSALSQARDTLMRRGS